MRQGVSRESKLGHNSSKQASERQFYLVEIGGNGVKEWTDSGNILEVGDGLDIRDEGKI